MEEFLLKKEEEEEEHAWIWTGRCEWDTSQYKIHVPQSIKKPKAFHESQQSPNPSSLQKTHNHGMRPRPQHTNWFVGQSIELVMKFSTMFSFMHAFRFCHFFQHVHVHLITTLKSTKKRINPMFYYYYYYCSIGKKWCPNSNFCNPRSYFQTTCFRLLPPATTTCSNGLHDFNYGSLVSRLLII